MSFRYKNLKNGPRGEGYPYRVSTSLPRNGSYEGTPRGLPLSMPRWSTLGELPTTREDSLHTQGQQGKLHCVLQKMAAHRRSQRGSKKTHSLDKENNPSSLRGYNCTYQPGDMEMYSNPSRFCYSSDSLSSLGAVSDTSSCELSRNESRDVIHFKKHAAQPLEHQAEHKNQEQLPSANRTLNAHSESGDCAVASSRRKERSDVENEGPLPSRRVPLRSLHRRDFHKSPRSDDEPASL